MEPGELQNNEFCLQKNYGQSVYQIETLTGMRPTLTSARHSPKIVDDSTVIDDAVTIGQSMLLEVDADDIEKLLEDNGIKLTTEELEHFQNEQEKKE